MPTLHNRSNSRTKTLWSLHNKNSTNIWIQFRCPKLSILTFRANIKDTCKLLKGKHRPIPVKSISVHHFSKNSNKKETICSVTKLSKKSPNSTQSRSTGHLSTRKTIFRQTPKAKSMELLNLSTTKKFKGEWPEVDFRLCFQKNNCFFFL